MSANPCDGTLTFGQQVARQILAAKKEREAKNGVLFLSDIAAIIDHAFAAASPIPAVGPQNVIPFDLADSGDRKVIPPKPEWVTAYSATIGYPLHGQMWCDSYQSKGWTVGKQKMRDWQAAVRNWKTNDWASPTMKRNQAQPLAQNYSKF